MQYAICILSHSINGLSDFIATTSGFLKDKIDLTDLHFYFIHLGDGLDNIDLPSINKAVRSTCSCEEVPTIYTVHMGDRSNIDILSKMCYDMIRNGPEHRAIFVDLVSKPAIMTGIGNRLFESFKADGQDHVSRMIFYAYKKYVDGDGGQFNFGGDDESSIAWFRKRLLHVLGLAG